FEIGCEARVCGKGLASSDPCVVHGPSPLSRRSGQIRHIRASRLNPRHVRWERCSEEPLISFKERLAPWYRLLPCLVGPVFSDAGSCVICMRRGILFASHPGTRSCPAVTFRSFGRLQPIFTR